MSALRSLSLVKLIFIHDSFAIGLALKQESKSDSEMVHCLANNRPL